MTAGVLKSMTMKSTSECSVVQLSRAEHWEIDQQGQIKHSSSGLDDLLLIIDFTFWWILDNDLEPYQAFTYILAYFVAGHCLLFKDVVGTTFALPQP